MNTTTKLELRRAADLVPYECNPRVHPPEQIAALRESIRSFGFVTPLLIDQAGGLVSGHARLIAAQAEGLELVPCVLVEHLTETQLRAYRLADNRLAEAASWDPGLLSVELEELKEAGCDLTLMGFSEEELYLDEAADVDEDDFEPVLPDEPVSKVGDLYQLGRHRLLCGDATSPEDLRRLMEGRQADLLLTDPPYNVNVEGQTKQALKILNDHFPDQAAFADFLASAFAVGKEHLAPGASFYIWHADGPSGWAFRDACRRVGLAVRQCLVWVKQAATLGRQDYHWQHEPCLHGELPLEELPDLWNEHESCLYGWKEGKAHLWRSDRKQTTVLEFDRPVRSEEHPTMKPVKLFAYQICNSTLPEAVVLDPFAGSGTTLVSCQETGRTAYLMELDPRCVDVIVRRWEALTGEKAEKVA